MNVWAVHSAPLPYIFFLYALSPCATRCKGLMHGEQSTASGASGTQNMSVYSDGM